MLDSIAVSVFVVILVDFDKYKSETSRLKEYPPEIIQNLYYKLYVGERGG